jgi:hypothetical protein
MNRNALYYPYIHVRDVSWLKATLLLFPEVRRMVPVAYTPEDGDGVRAFVERSLLTMANLLTARAMTAQEALANRLRADAQDPGFLSRYGRSAALESRGPNSFGFQIH